MKTVKMARKMKPRRSVPLRRLVLVECVPSATKSWDKRRKHGWRTWICQMRSFFFFGSSTGSYKSDLNFKVEFVFCF